MKETRGYSMPLPVKYWPPILAVAMWAVMIAFSLVSLSPIFRGYIPMDDTEQSSLRITTVLLSPLFLAELAICFTKLHIVPQGIALTLFGKTVRRVPAEKIRILSAVQYSRKLGAVEQIAVCTMSPGEINCATAEDLYHYLLVTAGFLRVTLNLNRRILWLEWSPERLKLLRRMYPDVSWIDGSPERQFDKQL